MWSDARRFAGLLDVDEEQDTVRLRDGSGRSVGLHDYGAMYTVPGLYEAVYFELLGGRSPHLIAEALTEVVPLAERGDRRVLDVGAGTGLVGERLREVGFGSIWATDLEPQSVHAIQRDRPETYVSARSLDLAAPDDEDRTWLVAAAPDVVTVAGAIGYGHLPADCLWSITELVSSGGLLALTVAPHLDTAPELARHAEVLRSPAWTEVVRRTGVHRRTAAGHPLPALVLVLRRTEQSCPRDPPRTATGTARPLTRAVSPG